MNDENETETAKGGRVRWLPYTAEESRILDKKLLNDPSNLDFLKDYWNVVYDESDALQYQRLANTWQMRHRGRPFKAISEAIHLDQQKACALISGRNCRPYLAQMYLTREKLGPLRRDGWKWILDCTPKPTNPYPRALQVPEQIRTHEEILEFLTQFPPISQESEALRFFGLTSAWAEEHKAELFWFLLGFLVGDAGKQYVHNENRSRHYRKTAVTTRMTNKDSNFRVLRYVQLALESLGMMSHQVHSGNEVVHWNSESSNIITWTIQVCLGLKEGETTSTHKLNMPWLKICPKNLIVAFLQGLADSDGSVDKNGYYADIASVPNSLFYKEVFDVLQIESHVYPKERPQQVRILLHYAVQLSLFNPIVRSYRHEQVISHAIRRKIIPPPPSFFLICR